MGSGNSHPTLQAAVSMSPEADEELTLEAAKEQIIALRTAARDFAKQAENPTPGIMERQDTYKFKPATAPETLGNSDNDAQGSRLSLPIEYKETNTVQSKIDKSGNEIVNQYTLREVLGRGSYATVRRCTNKEGDNFAIKVFNKKKLKRKRIGRFGNAMQTVAREMAIWKKLSHPNVLPLIEAIDSDDSNEIYFVSKLINGGALMPDESTCEPVAEEIAKVYFRQLILALDYLHFQNVIHRDVKPGNLLIERRDEEPPDSPGTLILADFGVAHAFDGNDDMMHATDGTAAFMAPEMCTGDAFNGKPTDIWAAGATLYMFVFGSPPFRAAQVGALYEAIQNDPLQFPSDIDISDALKDLLHGILTKDPHARLSLKDIMRHPWLTNNGEIPLQQEHSNSLVQITDDDVQSAITPIKQSTALFIVIRSSVLVRKARQSIMQRGVKK